MIHVVKVPLEKADLFIHLFNEDKRLLTYEIRDKETGVRLEPKRTSNYEIKEGKLMFDMRYITLELGNYINKLLN
jgi:hypothetical protein